MCAKPTSVVEFGEKLSWISCNKCLKKFSTSIQFLVLSCSDIFCGSCAHAQQTPNPVDPNKPRIKCSKCDVLMDWRLITPNMEANLLKRLFTSDDYEHNEYKKRQINYINDMLYKSISKSRAETKEMQRQQRIMNQKTVENERRIEKAKPTIHQHMHPEALEYLLNNISVEQLRTLDLTPYMQKTPNCGWGSPPQFDVEMWSQSEPILERTQSHQHIDRMPSLNRTMDSPMRMRSHSSEGRVPRAAIRSDHYRPGTPTMQAPCAGAASLAMQSNWSSDVETQRSISPVRNRIPTPPTLLKQVQRRAFDRAVYGVAGSPQQYQPLPQLPATPMMDGRRDRYQPRHPQQQHQQSQRSWELQQQQQPQRPWQNQPLQMQQPQRAWQLPQPQQQSQLPVLHKFQQPQHRAQEYQPRMIKSSGMPHLPNMNDPAQRFY